jgi:hypothetical protein
MKKMLASFAVLLLGLAFSPFADAQTKTTPASLFGMQEQRQILQLQKQLADQNAAQIAALQQQNTMIMQMLLQQKSMPQQAAPAPVPQPAPIIYYIYPPGGAPRLDPNPGTPKLDLNPGVPKLDLNPGVPKLDPNPGVPKLDAAPGTPKLDFNPGAPPKLDTNPGTPTPPGPPVGFQRFTNERPPVITAEITRPNGNATKWYPVYPQK